MTRKEKVRRAKLASNGYSPTAIRMLCRHGRARISAMMRLYWNLERTMQKSWARSEAVWTKFLEPSTVIGIQDSILGPARSLLGRP